MGYAVKLDGSGWRSVHSESDCTDTEVYQPNEPPLVRVDPVLLLREQRNVALSKSDWAVLPDSPLTDAELSEWIAYRQALRDLPANTIDPINPIWPEPPE